MKEYFLLAAKEPRHKLLEFLDALKWEGESLAQITLTNQKFLAIQEGLASGARVSGKKATHVSQRGLLDCQALVCGVQYRRVGVLVGPWRKRFPLGRVVRELRHVAPLEVHLSNLC